MKKGNRIVSIPRFTIFVAICTAIIIFAGSSLLNLFGVSYAEVESIDAFTTITVSTGDTLWDIAREYYPDETDVRHAVDKIERVNGLRTSTITTGQQLHLPQYLD